MLLLSPRPAFAVWIVVAVAVMWPQPMVIAQSVEEGAGALAHQLMSPYCPGLLLADCRSTGAQELRAEILRRLQAGEESDVIEADLVARFGAGIRTVPEFKGVGLVLWLGPVVCGLAGAGIVVVVVRTAASRDGPPNADEAANVMGGPGMDERLQAELDALE
ncbi:MAG TPA: cytochrome c-type biogenesis protein CcmH [Vicinamibacterales bacterium]